MSFVKLDCGILNSTLWIERGPRDIFITALLMAEPREILEPMPQLRAGVDCIEETGFVVPPGWYGFVPASGPGIVRMAMTLNDEGLAALISLGEPDPESRSHDFEGRRLIRVDGGYIVLNYIAYREKDATTADRSKRWRERQKQKESSRATRVADTPTRVIRHQAEAEAEEEQKQKKREKPVSRNQKLQTWLDSLGEVDAIPADDPIFEYATKARIPLEFLELSWKRFCEDMHERGTLKANWRAHYRNAVRGNWYKIWWFAPDGECQLTTVGKQAQRVAA